MSGSEIAATCTGDFSARGFELGTFKLFEKSATHASWRQFPNPSSWPGWADNIDSAHCTHWLQIQETVSPLPLLSLLTAHWKKKVWKLPPTFRKMLRGDSNREKSATHASWRQLGITLPSPFFCRETFHQNSQLVLTTSTA